MRPRCRRLGRSVLGRDLGLSGPALRRLCGRRRSRRGDTQSPAPRLVGERTIAGERMLAQAAVLVSPGTQLSAFGRLRRAMTQRATLSDGARRPHLLRRLAIDRTGANDSEQPDRCHAASPRIKAQTAFATRTSRRTLPSNDSVVISRAKVICRFAGLLDGRYWARTSDPQLVELVLSQLS